MDGDNPFGDDAISQPFRWEKKLEKEGLASMQVKHYATTKLQWFLEVLFQNTFLKSQMFVLALLFQGHFISSG